MPNPRPPRLVIAGAAFLALAPVIFDNPVFPWEAYLGPYHDAVWALHTVPMSMAAYLGGFGGGAAFAAWSTATVFLVEIVWEARAAAQHLGGEHLVRQGYVVIFVTAFNAVTLVAMGSLVRQLRREQAALERANAELAEAAVRDPLTGLHNRRFLFEHLGRELSAARRAGTGLTVIMVDLDRLKEINDAWGHQAGDRALREAAALMRRLTREEDVVCRYGGDEFTLVLPRTGPEEGLRLLERLFAEARSRRVTLGPGLPDYTPHFSAGIAAFPAHADSVDALVAQADAALYLAKHDPAKVCLATPPRAGGAAHGR